MHRTPRVYRTRRAIGRFLLIALAGWSALSAQTTTEGSGAIAGRVVNPSTGLGIVSVTVTVADFGTLATTDLGGSFVIPQVPAGTRSLILVKDGFQTTTVAGVVVTVGETARVDTPLTPIGDDVVMLAAFSVSADILQQSGLGLLLARQRSVAVSDAISSEEFSRLALGNAAEALAKTPGTTIVDGKFVVIRGLGDRYTNTQMNGSSVPSADPDKRAVQMDQFPSDLTDSITTLKSFTPDQPGAFSGGSVNIKTKSFPEEFFVTASISGGHNSLATGEDILTVPGGGRDWQARDDGTRALSDSIPNPLPPSLVVTTAQIFARQGNFGPAEELDAISKSFNNKSFFPKTKKADPNFGTSFGLGDSWNFANDRVLAYIASLNYSRSFSHYTGGITSRYAQGSTDPDSPAFVDIGRLLSPNIEEYNFAAAYAANPLVPGGDPSFGVTESSQDVDWGAYFQLATKLGLNHEITATFLHNQSASDTVKRGVGESTRSDTGAEFRENYDLLYTERGITSLQLAGKSNIVGWNDATLDWRASTSRSTQDQPDYRSFEFKWNFQQQAYDPSGITWYRYFRELEENADEFAADLTLPFYLSGGQELSLKFGGAHNNGERTNRERAFQIVPAAVVDRTLIDNFPNPVGIIGRTANSVSFGTTMRELPANLNYDGEQTFSAGYAMGDWRVSERWRFIGGVRFERTEIITTPIPAAAVVVEEGEIRQTDALPAFSAVWSPFEKQNFRFSYGRTLARPTFRELADVTNYEAFTDEFVGGNPDLKLTIIDNFDLRWEWFPRGSEVMAASLFYKKLSDPIETVFQAGRIFPENVEEGIVYGIELEARRSLGFLSETWANLSVGGNLSFIESEVTISAAELALIRAVFPEGSDKRELFGQSPYVLNLDATYNVPSWRANFTLVYAIFGERLGLVTTGALPDVYEQPAAALDFIYAQGLGRGWKVKLTARNLLDPNYEQTLTTSGQTFVYERYRRGRSISLSLGYDFR